MAKPTAKPVKPAAPEWSFFTFSTYDPVTGNADTFDVNKFGTVYDATTENGQSSTEYYALSSSELKTLDKLADAYFAQLDADGPYTTTPAPTSEEVFLQVAASGFGMRDVIRQKDGVRTVYDANDNVEQRTFNDLTAYLRELDVKYGYDVMF